MTHLAFLIAPMHGHVNPTLPVARELVARGHRVTYWLTAQFRDAMVGTGAEFREIPSPPPDPRLPADTDPLVTLALIPARLAAAAVEVLPGVLDGVRDLGPDTVVVYDQLCVWGRLVAEVAGLPAAMLCTTYASNERFSFLTGPQARTIPRIPAAMEVFDGDLGRLADRYGTPRLPLPALFFHAEPVTVVFTTREFHPAADTFDDRYTFVGPTVTADPPRVADPAGDLVYVSLGTVFNDWPELLPICATAFDGGDWRVVLSTGGREVPPAPDHLTVLRHAPQVALLAEAAAFVTHGGMGSTMEALQQGVPLVVIPQTPEQAVTAERVVDLGLGVHLDRAATTPAALRAAVERVARAGGYRRQLARMRESVRGAGGARTAADALERRCRSRAEVTA
ncbi:glycosyltransferase, MGT family [Micromonospora pallida]|uniref:Glycosyltransferase, MGT family n=1 Tax=Micromonospora pallida TaxID=145854 RepID=A0A1C6RW35_9ACTN|nr:macrolide family glycosyltransferase [Micromonospora pallida]SCL21417.1 glycosyltransferase, MGT family [Micromonospora pallida]